MFVHVDWLSYFMRLTVDGNNYGGCFVVHSHISIIIADLFNGVPGDFFYVDGGIGVDLAEDHADWIFDGSFACNFGLGIFGEAGVEDGVGNVIAEFVGMAAGDVFGGEEEMTWFELEGHR